MPGSNRGVALILVMWVMLVLVFLALGMGIMARTEMHISRNYADLMRCRWAARSGVYAALAEIGTLAGEDATYLGEDPYVRTSEDSNIDLSGYGFEYEVQDESGRVNVNTAPLDTLSRLFDDEGIAYCIVDWRDSDSMPESLGAESDYYQGLQTPYNSRNAPFQTTGELKLVKGVTEDVLSTPTVDGGRAVSELLTVYAGSAGESQNDGQVDIQTANSERLQSTLGSIFTAQEIDSIVRYRTSTPFRSTAEILRVPGLSRSKIMEAWQRLTVSSSSPASGLLNVNTASAQAIAVQPGMDMAAAESIIEYRAANGAFDSVGRLLALSEITDQAFISAAPGLAVRSRLFRVVCTGSMASGARATIVCAVDAVSGSPVQIRYWQE